MSKASSSSKRTSSRAKKEIDYAAMQEIKIEEVDVTESDDEITEIPTKKRKLASLEPAELVTEGKCGQCDGCKRTPCSECSFCLNGDTENCIDLYCMNQNEGRKARAAAREAYLMAISGKKAKQESTEDDEEYVEDVFDDELDEEAPSSDLSVKEQIDKIMEQIGAKKDKKSPGAAKSKVVYVQSPGDKKKPAPKSKGADPLKTRVHLGVYGGSATAAKLRRCGECEGCMRDDCGTCYACADKPRFGGKGTKKKACVLRYCRTRKLEEDHAQANFPLNSPDALKGPRPVSKLGRNPNPKPAGIDLNPIKQDNTTVIDAGRVQDEEEIADEIEDSVLQD